MTEQKLNRTIFSAAKWSGITEITARLVTPITSMILARLLSPTEFGVLATVIMIVSFADMLTDAGFQKYLIQHEFKEEKEKYNYTNVAFITNFVISLLLWLGIAIFSEKIATIVGNPGLGNVVIVACFSLPLTSFSSIQISLYRRSFDFKTLFITRIIAVLVPFFVTIPLALMGFSYWSLIIGTICGNLSNAIILTVKSRWKPKLYFNFSELKNMISFSVWSLIEAISIWFTSYIDTFIIASSLSTYYLGIYKTSTNLVNVGLSIITASITPVLFSGLSRLQNDQNKFNELFFRTQQMIAFLVLPLGVGLFLYSDFATRIMLGNKWNEASKVIGIWALISSIMIVFSSLNGEVFRAKGKPKLSFLSQILHLIVLIPACIFSAKYGFWPLVFTRAWIRLELLMVGLLFMQFIIKISILKMIQGLFPIIISTIGMSVIGCFTRKIYQGVVWDISTIVLCGTFYFVILFLFHDMRVMLFNFLRYVKLNKKIDFSKMIKTFLI